VRCLLEQFNDGGQGQGRGEGGSEHTASGQGIVNPVPAEERYCGNVCFINWIRLREKEAK